MRRHSPYNYAFNNPLRFIDSDGMKPSDIIIKGNLTNNALDQLRSKFEGQLNFSINNDSGKVTVTAIEGVTKTAAADVILNASEDSSMKIQIAASDDAFTQSGMANIGVFEYAKVSKTGTKVNGKIATTTKQSTNPDKLEQMDNFFGEKKGTSFTHELVESIIAGKKVQERGVSSGNGNSDNNVYDDSHNEASTIAPAAGSLTPMINENNKVERFDMINGKKRETLWEHP